MRPTINVIRAVGAEFARRTLRPIIIIGAILAIALLALGGWLTTQSAWWWLLETVFILASLLFLVLTIVVHIMLRAVEPTLTKTQRRSVGDFVSKLEGVSENIQTPQFVIIYYVIRDTVHPRRDGFIENVARDSKTLAPDFAKLRREFE